MVKYSVEILQNFVAFPDYLNFNRGVPGSHPSRLGLLVCDRRKGQSVIVMLAEGGNTTVILYKCRQLLVFA